MPAGQRHGEGIVEERVASAGDLADGQMINVSVAGKDTLLARVDGRFYATEATCPHWGGPLPEGLLSGPRLLCPWHKATFDVRDGTLVEPPSLDPIVRFAVRVEGDDVYVERLETEPTAQVEGTVQGDDDERLFVIVGGGAAAAAAAEKLRHEGYSGRVLMVSPERRTPYDRPNLSKDYLSGDLDAEWLPLRDEAFYVERGIERRLARVEALDVGGRELQLSDGTSLTADGILIASGARPRRLEVPGADLRGIHTLRTPEDADALIAAAGRTRRVVVVGSSFIGMEVAASLVRRGLDVTVTGPDAVPLASALGTTIGAMIREYHEQNGTSFELGSGVARFVGDGAVTDVELENGALLEASLVVVGVGVRPVTEFMRGVQVDDDGGLPVDERLRLSEGVWAAGDVARYRDAHTGREQRIEHWRLAEQHGRAAAADMAGRGAPFTEVPFFWTEHFDLSLGHAGLLHPGADAVVYGDLAGRDFTALYAEDDELLAACGTQPNELAAFMELMRGDALPGLSELEDRGEVGFTRLLARPMPS